MRLTALELASHAGLFVVRVQERGAVRRDGPYLLIGPGARSDTIATIAARRLVELRGGTEAEVRDEVECWGHRYHADSSRVPVKATSSSPRPRRRIA